VLRVGGIISTDAQDLTQTEDEIERLQRVVRKAALEAVTASARAQTISRRLAARARIAAWVGKKKTATPDEIAAAVDLDARANTAATTAKQAEVTALVTTTEAARCRTLVRLVPESPAVRKALAEAARTKLLLDFASAKYAAEQLALAIESQNRVPPAVAVDSPPRKAGAASATRAVPPSLEDPSLCRGPKFFKGWTSREWLRDC
jgi:hypothetical protein